MTYINTYLTWGHFFSHGTLVWPWPVIHLLICIWVRKLVLTKKLYSKLRQLHARCVRTTSHITLTQSRMYQIPTREIETELGWTQWTNRNTSPAVNCDGLDMSAACPLIVYFDVCPLLGYPARDQGGAPEMTIGKIMIKALKTFDIDPKHLPAMAANRTNWRHIRINQ